MYSQQSQSEDVTINNLRSYDEHMHPGECIAHFLIYIISANNARYAQ
jgi:hypothetical protein